MNLQDSIKLLIYNAELYHSNKETTISDNQFDALEELIYSKLDNTQKDKLWKKLHFPKSVSGWSRANHKIPMGSLNKISPNSSFTREGFFDTIYKTQFLVQEKLDGISLSIEYENGVLVSAKMRNDGIEGDDIYNNAKWFKGVLNKLPINANVSIRGEVLITKDDFAKVNELSNNKYTALRNSASGIARDFSATYVKYLTFKAYDIASTDMSFTKEEDKIIFLGKSLGFDVVNSTIANNLEELKVIEDDYINGKREQLDYLIDGLVLKENVIVEAVEVGVVENPTNQIAIKFPAMKATTELLDIQWQFGMRHITPVLILKPVVVGEVTIQKATLHNIKFFNEVKLSKGDQVIISRSGDVIPFFEGIAEKNQNGELFTAPTTCEKCGASLYENGAYLECSNEECDAKQFGKILNWFTKLGYTGLGEATIADIYDKGIAKSILDFYDINEYHLMELDRIGEVSANKITNIIYSKSLIPFHKVLGSLNIKNFSVSNANRLVEALHINSIEKLKSITVEQIQSVEGFGQTSVQIHASLMKEITFLETLRDTYEDFFSFYLLERESVALEGLKFCFTGDCGIPRNELSVLIKTHGGVVSSSVTSKTNYLINNDGIQKGKYNTAKKLGIPIINLDTLKKMLE